MFRLTLKRILKDWRLVGVLLLTMSLAAGFLAFGPMYVRMIAAASLQQRVSTEIERTFQLTLRNQTVLDRDFVDNTVDTTLGAYAGEMRQFYAAQPWICASPRGCYRPYAFSEFDSLFALKEGRLPSNTPQNGIDVEAVVLPRMTEMDRAYIGQQFILGEDSDTAITVEVVGIVDALLPETAPYWEGMTIFDVVNTPVGDNTRPDVSFIVSEDAYLEHVTVAVTDIDRIVMWRVMLNREWFTAARADDFLMAYHDFSQAMRLEAPNINLNTGVVDLLESFQRSVEEAQAPVILLSFLIFALMLYNCITIAALLMEQRQEEWIMFSSRGSSTLQLVQMQVIINLLLAIAALVGGLVIAWLTLLILATVGPQADVLGMPEISLIQMDTFALLAIALVLIVIGLTIPTYVAATRSLAVLKQAMARPPQTPIWARFGLDFGLIALGLIFVVRLVSQVANVPLETIISQPEQLLDVLTSQDFGAQLNDPFTLAAPALLIMGSALLWMRLFPLIVSGIGRLTEVRNGLTSRLAFWNVARDPAHYAQLVLLLIITLSLGTASILLDAARQENSRSVAVAQVGADAAIDVIPAEYDDSFDPMTLPGVEAASDMMVVPVNAAREITLLGVDPAELDAFPDLATPLNVLHDIAAPDLGGLQVSEEAQTIALDIMSLPDESAETSTTIAAFVDLIDTRGLFLSMELVPQSRTSPGTFSTYQTNPLPCVGPWTLLGIRLTAEQAGNDDFVHTVIMDALVAGGTSQQLASFDADTLDDWRWERGSDQMIENASLIPETERYTQGDGALLVRYSVETYGPRMTQPALVYRPVVEQPMPVLISPAFAEAYGTRSSLRRPLDVGDTITTELIIQEGFQTAYISNRSIPSRTLNMRYTVAGIIPEMPMFEPDALYLVTTTEWLQLTLNQDASLGEFHEPNRTLLKLNGERPSSDFYTATETIPGLLKATAAWDIYQQLLRDPLTNAITGVLLVGFWISLILGIIDFAFYMIVTIRRRAMSLATLKAIGWRNRNILGLLAIEQSIVIVPALIIGLIFGVGLTLVLQPMLGIHTALVIPVTIWALPLILIVAFALTLVSVMQLVYRNSVQIMRFGE
ncbi:MAG: hypothetical protein CL607_26055 [Anaerolineaceae bacterium]|nr:hypothetical protein [Anaerolineaceae bacterium]